jgi:tetratricopeptide (TPR) repeat protein
MKKHISTYFLLTLCFVLMQSCLMENPERKMQKYASLYENKEITNSLMLFEMGKIFREYPDNPTVRNEYFQKMIISGYASHIIHLFLSQQEKPLTEEDMKVLIYAMQKGNQYNLAEKFTERFIGDYRNQLKKIFEVNDSVKHYNDLIKAHSNAGAYEKRGKFFTRLNAADMANIDFDRSIRLNPCNPGAVFEKVVLQFNQENTGEVIRLLELCSQSLTTEELNWYPVFYNLAKELEAVKEQSLPEKEHLFRLANLYINNGFPELALRKSTELLKIDGNNNPDYLALQGFIYFKMNNKEQAVQYVSMAENISGRKSKLSEMIAKME